MRIQRLQVLAESLIESGFVIESRAVRVSRSGREEIIEIGNTGPLSGANIVRESSVNFYLETIRQDRLSWLLFDASIIQIWYRRRGDRVAAHRYCYIPAPFDLDLRREASDFQVTELIEGSSVNDPFNQTRRTVLRFEYEPEAQASNHPAAHLHLNTPGCRIPMRSAISIREFIHFLLRFLYSETFDARELARLAFSGASTLSVEEERGFHINWRLV
jgi:hypothetical protein